MDDFTLSLIVGLAGSAVFSLVLVLLWRASRKAAAGRRALAQARGLMFDEHPAQGGRAGRYVFTDTARGLVLEITRPRQGDGGTESAWQQSSCGRRSNRPSRVQRRSKRSITRTLLPAKWSIRASFTGSPKAFISCRQ